MSNKSIRRIVWLFQFRFCTILLSRKSHARSLMLLFVTAGVFTTAHADTQYIYDAAGRLIQVIAANGETADYQYDLNDNIIAIQRFPLATLPTSTLSQTASLSIPLISLDTANYRNVGERHAVTK